VIRTPIGREALAALSGLLLVLSFPKFGHGAVAWVALTPLLIAVSGASPGRAFRLGYVTGGISALGLLYWIVLIVTHFGGLPWVVGAIVTGLLCLIVALFTAVVAWMVALFGRSLGGGALLLTPVAWVGVEVFRAYTFLRFPWCLLGYSQYAWPQLIQPAALGGVYAVSFIVAMSSSLLAFAAVERRVWRHRLALIAAPLLVALTWTIGAWRLRGDEPPARSLRVGLVQASIPQDEKWDSAKAWSNIDRHAALTQTAADRGARLIVWPESSLPFYYDLYPPAAGLMQSLAESGRAHILFGNDDRDNADASGPRVFVGAKLIDPQGRLTMRYHKVRLVPFGEYVPFQPLLTLGGRYSARLVREVSDFAPGVGPVWGEVDGVRLGTLICYEDIFPDLSRAYALGGADVLVNITNDGWYGWTSAPYQHMAMALFRAVETGRPLLRAANTGITAVVDAKGRVVQATRLFERTALVRDVPLRAIDTPYLRVGDSFAFACLACALAFTLVCLRRGAR
jgi:apolipoprotein N-acyltransferase